MDLSPPGSVRRAVRDPPLLPPTSWIATYGLTVEELIDRAQNHGHVCIILRRPTVNIMRRAWKPDKSELTVLL
jgi:hypothetical protein